MIFGKKERAKPAEEKEDRKAKPVEGGSKKGSTPDIKLSEPIQRLIGEKDAEIEELRRTASSQESKIEELKAQFDALTAEKKELAEKLKEKETEAGDLKSKFQKSEDKLAEVEKELGEVKEAGRMAEVPLEELVYVYILGAGGEIAVPQCAKALEVEKKRVKDAIDKLVKSGRLGR